MSYTRDPARLWAGTITGTAPIRSSVAWLTVWACVCCSLGFLLTEPLLLGMTCGDEPLLAVTTRVLCGAGSRWVPLAQMDGMLALPECREKDWRKSPKWLNDSVFL